MPQLIVNADDLGLTRGVNSAIFLAHRTGIVTSATLMANAPAFEDAVAALLPSPAYTSRKLGIGCHIVLVDGTPVSPPEGIKTLLAESAQPRFLNDLWKFALAAVFGGISVDAVEIEATAQIRKIQKAGIELSHVDCHKHTHMFPNVLEGVLRAAQSCNIPAIRNPFEPAFARRREIVHASAARRMETAALYRLYGKAFVRRVSDFGLVTTDGSLGVTATGTLDMNTFRATIRNLPAKGMHEFVCHPGYNDAELATAGTRLLQSRETELQLLRAPEADEALRSSHVERINFWDLAPAAESNPAVAHPTP